MGESIFLKFPFNQLQVQHAETLVFANANPAFDRSSTLAVFLSPQAVYLWTGLDERGKWLRFPLTHLHSASLTSGKLPRFIYVAYAISLLLDLAIILLIAFNGFESVPLAFIGGMLIWSAILVVQFPNLATDYTNTTTLRLRLATNNFVWQTPAGGDEIQKAWDREILRQLLSCLNTLGVYTVDEIEN